MLPFMQSIIILWPTCVQSAKEIINSNTLTVCYQEDYNTANSIVSILCILCHHTVIILLQIPYMNMWYQLVGYSYSQSASLRAFWLYMYMSEWYQSSKFMPLHKTHLVPFRFPCVHVYQIRHY